MARNRFMRVRTDPEIRAGPIRVRCLSCNHSAEILRAGAMVTITKKLVCSECGSRAVAAERVRPLRDHPALKAPRR
jgi:DNA-directed RNA polymerase subunit RPC12/RpoP